MHILTTLTAPDTAPARVYRTAAGYSVTFGYVVGGELVPSNAKPPRAYMRESSALSAARAWVA